MNKPKELRAAVEEIEAKTKAARLRSVLPEIEQRLSAGARIADVVDALNRSGLQISIATLKSYLYRFRKAQQAQAPSSVGVTEAKLATHQSDDEDALDEQEIRWQAGTTTAAMTPMLLRHINTARCLRLLRRGAAFSRADLARELGLTRATIGYAVRELIDSGLVAETVDRLEGGRPGRPGSGVCINPEGAYSIGIEIATTSMNAILVDLGMRVVHRVSEPAEYGKDDFENALEQLIRLPNRLLAATKIDRSRIQGVCISVPGLVDRGGQVVVAPFLGWYGVPLKQLMSSREEIPWPVTVVNDAVAFAHAERTMASESDTQNMLLMLLSEGLGGAIVQRGQILEGANGYAGELGHMVMSASPKTTTGQSFEALAGYHRFRPFFPKGLPLAESLQWLAENCNRLANPKLEAAFDEWAEVLTTGILNLIYLFDPEKIVLGGPLSALFAHVEPRVKKSLASNLLRGYKPPPIFVARFGADGAAIGAAAVVRDELFSLPQLGDA